ncbi:MAG: HU family DNA-binding protein [Gammaproteobacteria bacterium]|nr:HU family DNA-binding protein [Gammaproteobacteria bacterium]
MVTKEVIKLLSDRMNISQRQAKQLLELQINAITKHLQRRHNVIMRDFGTVGIKDMPARRAYIPSEKSICEIPAHQKLFFRAANKLKEFVKHWRPSA